MSFDLQTATACLYFVNANQLHESIFPDKHGNHDHIV